MTTIFTLEWEQWGHQTLIDVFATRELAEARIVEDALKGVTIKNCNITERTLVDGKPDPGDILSIPGVREEIAAGRKIQAIKVVRNACVGFGLREAKVAVENVWDLVTPNAPDANNPVRSSIYANYMIDMSGDTWVHVGSGQYTLIGDNDKLSELFARWSKDQINEEFSLDYTSPVRPPRRF
jgi:hypothetical protein